ncbi:C40 family peptidase [Cellulophaga baltica]|nr:C40 family peptidase [Cellulophaga baltica]MDO6767284.1 SH3 domain-containing C40 family peptidase [Cellulophaga sp. 1_MG-2023]
MVKHLTKIFSIHTILLIVISCSYTPKNNAVLIDEIINIKSEFAPDKRVALFNIEATKSGDLYILRGESNLPDAVDKLKKDLEKQNINFIDSVQILPSNKLNGATKGLISNSVSNLRSNPKHSAELGTQATLGTPVNVLKQDGEWYLIQTPDMYLSWVDHGGITLLTTDEFTIWKDAKKIIYTNVSGSSYATATEDAQIVSDLVAGDVLELISEDEDFYEVKYPDARTAFVNKSEAIDYSKWLQLVNPSAENLIATSKKLMGLPYLWGGTSTKGVDCSGFTKTIYFLNGFVIPRDASQQVHTGELIDDDKDFSKLKPGDLLFFGTPATPLKKERVVHVGMWIGNNEFIHSSGKVRISSVDKNAPNFDTENLNRYLRTKRLINTTDNAILNLKETAVFN